RFDPVTGDLIRYGTDFSEVGRVSSVLPESADSYGGGAFVDGKVVLLGGPPTANPAVYGIDINTGDLAQITPITMKPITDEIGVAGTLAPVKGLGVVQDGYVALASSGGDFGASKQYIVWINKEGTLESLHRIDGFRGPGEEIQHIASDGTDVY